MLLLVASAVQCFAAVSVYVNPVSVQGGGLTGILQCADGMLLTDTYNKIVWKVKADGTVERAAGNINVADLSGEPVGMYEDGTLETALFTEPWGIAPFLDGYAVSDAGANVIRFVNETGVQTAAGTGEAGLVNGTVGIVNGRVADIRFDRPTGLAADDSGNLYIADTNNGVIRKLTEKGELSTYASGLVEPTGLYWTEDGLYVAETGRNSVVAIKKDGIHDVCGGAGAADSDFNEGSYTDGPVAKAAFDHPQGVAVAQDGTVYIADTGNGAVRMLKDGVVTTVAVADNSPEGPVEPKSILIQADGSLLVTDSFCHTVLKVASDTASGTEFSDVKDGDWFAPAVETAVARGLVNGTGHGQFSPEMNVSRAMFVTMLGRLHESLDRGAVIGGDAMFSDVEAGSWYADSVNWAASQGIAQGAHGQFYPDRDISRQELAVFLYRYAVTTGLESGSYSGSGPAADFTDADRIEDWASEAVNWAVAKGIINGMGDGTVAPAASATRAQAVKMMTSFMDIYGL